MYKSLLFFCHFKLFFCECFKYKSAAGLCFMQDWLFYIYWQNLKRKQKISSDIHTVKFVIPTFHSLIRKHVYFRTSGVIMLNKLNQSLKDFDKYDCQFISSHSKLGCSCKRVLQKTCCTNIWVNIFYIPQKNTSM